MKPKLRWGSLRAFDKELRQWAAARMPYSRMAENLQEQKEINVTASGVRAYCHREGFAVHKPSKQAN